LDSIIMCLSNIHTIYYSSFSRTL